MSIQIERDRKKASENEYWQSCHFRTESDPNTDPNFVDPPPIIADLDCD